MSIKYNIPFDLDSPERTIAHQKIIKEKCFLRKLYEEWYKVFTDAIYGLPDGKIIELGSGGGFLKEIRPSVICTDILKLPSNDMTFSALEMPFSDSELSAIFMIDTFHHIPDSFLFLKEADRVLQKNGKIIMIEPANSLWGRFIYKNFHHEPFEPNGGWEIPISGPLSGANGALPWIVFERDYEKFSELFPHLKIEKIQNHTPLMYLISGGLAFKQLLPDFSYCFFRGFDKLLALISKQFSMFVTIEIRKPD
ncbi:MAG TPA: class I SAM-dependent methyltransferase [Draconibacterium sp.]|nr:class I SAM-dependent methyltransferase [Draconibacterium sp.]